MTTEEAEPRRVQKPWGEELIWAHTERYVGKVLVIEAGHRLSLQRHEIKDESIYVVTGRLRLWLEDETGDGSGGGARTPVSHGGYGPAASIDSRPIERCELIEVSTPELDDVVRLEDDFGREGTSAP